MKKTWDACSSLIHILDKSQSHSSPPTICFPRFANMNIQAVCEMQITQTQNPYKIRERKRWIFKLLYSDDWDLLASGCVMYFSKSAVYQLPFILVTFWTIFPYKIWQKFDKYDCINEKFKNLSAVTETVFWWLFI